MFKRKEISFLVANIQYNALGFLKISNGNHEICSKSAWLGDIEGFNFFQKEFTNIKEEKGKEKFDLFKVTEEAFNNVILSQDILTIGGITTIVGTTRNGFEYLMKTVSISGRDIEMKSTNGKMVPLYIGSAKEGSFNYSYLVSQNHLKQAIGIHYFDGSFGVFSYPEKCRSFQLYQNVNAKSFVQQVKEEHGIKLGGLLIEKY